METLCTFLSSFSIKINRKVENKVCSHVPQQPLFDLKTAGKVKQQPALDFERTHW